MYKKFIEYFCNDEQNILFTLKDNLLLVQVVLVFLTLDVYRAMLLNCSEYRFSLTNIN